jgi:hypothetical protein
MPSWVQNDDIWKRARQVVSTTRKKKKADFTDTDWGLVTHIYKRMGGTVKAKTNEAKERAVTPGRIKEPPAHIADKEKWNEAVTKVAAQSKKKQKDFEDKDYAAVTAIYKNLGGTFKKKNESLITASRMLEELKRV